jgi:lysophospholipase L1-like esterase
MAGASRRGLNRRDTFRPPGRAPLAALFLVLAASLLATPARADWAAAWTAAPFPAIRKLIERDERSFADQTVRQYVRLSASGERLRLRLTNELGTAPVTFAEVRVAIADPAGRLKPDSVRLARFDGRSDGTIPAGGPRLSDPIPLAVRTGAILVVSVHYRAPATPAAHLLEVRIAPGNQAASPRLTGARSVRAPALAAAVEIWRPAKAPVIVAFGDSITEGDGSTAGAHRDWPSLLSGRLVARRPTRGWSVVNAGINGNRLLRDGAGRNALARFDRDALAVAGVTHILLLEGINDIGWGSQPDRADEQVSAGELIAAYRQLIARAEARRVTICGGTVLPYRGSLYWNEAGEEKRQAVNRWIRASGAFDCVIDFEHAVADPADPSSLAPGLHRGDHLHPNDAGYAAMARTAERVLQAMAAASPSRESKHHVP